MGLFTPAWKNKDPLKRCEAVKTLKDQEKLKTIAAQDPERYVRYAALERITDETFLAVYALKINHDGLREHAIKSIHSVPVLVQVAAMLKENNSACIACFEQLPGQLPREALNVLYQAGGWAALHAAERMKDVPALKKLLNDSDSSVRYRAERALQGIEKEQQMKSADPDLQRRLLLESADEELVLGAADKLHDDELIFRRLVTEASEENTHREWNWKLGGKLTEKLSDPSWIKRLLEEGNDRLRRMTAEAACKRLMAVDPDYIAGIAQDEKTDSTVRREAVGVLTDPGLLAEIGLKYPDMRFYVMLNKHFNGDMRLVEAVLNDPDVSKNDLEKAVKFCSDPELILKRLAAEQKPDIIAILCSGVPSLKPCAEEIKTVLKGGPVAVIDYGRRAMTQTVKENFSRDAEKQLAVWTDSARRLIDYAKTQPSDLKPLWDRLDAAITGSVAEIRYHRYLDTGKSEWDSDAQDFKFSFDEKSWTETRPTGLVFPRLRM